MVLRWICCQSTLCFHKEVFEDDETTHLDLHSTDLCNGLQHCHRQKYNYLPVLSLSADVYKRINRTPTVKPSTTLLFFLCLCADKTILAIAEMYVGENLYIVVVGYAIFAHAYCPCKATDINIMYELPSCCRLYQMAAHHHQCKIHGGNHRYCCRKHPYNSLLLNYNKCCHFLPVLSIYQ